MRVDHSGRGTEDAWAQAVLGSLRDPVMIFDVGGLVLQVNQAFTDLFGFTMEDGPFVPPYPWWPTETEDAEWNAVDWRLWTQANATGVVDAEVVFYTKDRRPLWIHSVGSTVVHPTTGTIARIRILRDISREKQAQHQRATAAEISSVLAEYDDLGLLVMCVEKALAVLFGGVATIEVDTGGRYLFSGGQAVSPEELPPAVATGLAGQPSPDTVTLRAGILLARKAGKHNVRAWVQFPRPRRIGVDEMVVADLLAQSLGLAVDRLLATSKQANLEHALESHRLIGQAVGVLVERHRLTPVDAYERLRHASQDRNIKLRELATRLLETGLDPETA